MQLDVSFSELTHIEASLKIALGNFETVAAFGTKQFDQDIFELKAVITKVEALQNSHLTS
jgi:hypothetical protein